ncbi:MAG: tRNA epoxyqueuosine(34) reductase QueG [Pseudomonadota bacterium]
MRRDESLNRIRELRRSIDRAATDLGFDDVGVSDIELSGAGERLRQWLAAGRHGTMHWMARHGAKRWTPDALVGGTLRVISVRMEYLPESAEQAVRLLDHPNKAYVSRYALGRDYHKIMRPRLQKLANAIERQIGAFGYRAFVDSAPVMEKPLAQKAGLGWIGKHTNLIDKNAGSWFFLGELYTDLKLPLDEPATDHCGSCRACIDVCPTNAITAPYELDARRCISYLTIEHEGSIPESLREAIGNRIYGCDDCQLFCPWNKFAQLTREPDFAPRNDLDRVSLVDLASQDEQTWLSWMTGSAIRRIGFSRWRRNIAVALGNATDASPTIDEALSKLAQCDDALVVEHALWGQRQRAQKRTKSREQDRPETE